MLVSCASEIERTINQKKQIEQNLMFEIALKFIWKNNDIWYVTTYDKLTFQVSHWVRKNQHIFINPGLVFGAVSGTDFDILTVGQNKAAAMRRCCFKNLYELKTQLNKRQKNFILILLLFWMLWITKSTPEFFNVPFIILVVFKSTPNHWIVISCIYLVYSFYTIVELDLIVPKVTI